MSLTTPIHAAENTEMIKLICIFSVNSVFPDLTTETTASYLIGLAKNNSPAAGCAAS